MAPSVRPTAPPLMESRANSYYTQLVVKRATASSRLLHNKHEQSIIPTFEKSKLVIGQLLGTGAFSNVYELKGIELQKETSDDCQTLTKEQQQAREKLARDTNKQTCRYAIKLLKSDADPDAAADLLLEQHYLTALTVRFPHENIIKLHGKGDAFLILERVEETLSERMEKWRQQQNDCFLLERLDAALQLSAAMMHLHRLGIMYRDLKPNNIGYSRTGVLKLFDFGLVKELCRDYTKTIGAYCMSGITGSYKYMAPEVLRRKPYIFSADVYSYAMVLVQILSLQQEQSLFEGYSKRQYIKQVVVNNERPTIKEEWSSSLKQLLEQCWAPEPSKRPTMKYIHAMLQEEIKEMMTRD